MSRNQVLFIVLAAALLLLWPSPSPAPLFSPAQDIIFLHANCGGL